jgi:leader peptidase (prepilin peptidase) / N-methyltransferase
VTPDLLPVVLVGVLGLLVGSFLNVCIHRLPAGQSIVRPASRCPRCGRSLQWYQNIPVLSWLALRGRCASCGEPISIRYPLVELVTGLTFAGGTWLFGPTLLLVSRLIFASAMIVLFFTDLEHRILPNVITLPGTVVGLLFSLVLPPGFWSATIGVLVWPLALFAIGEAVSRWVGRPALGLGDVKMLAMIAAFLGWQLAFLTVFLASLVGAVIGLAGLTLGRGRYYEWPLGCYLAVAALIAAAVGEPIMGWYLSLYQAP